MDADADQFDSHGLERSGCGSTRFPTSPDFGRNSGSEHWLSGLLRRSPLPDTRAWELRNVPNSDGSQDRQLSGDLTWTKGAHNLKFGVQANWLQTNFLSSQQSSGIFTFNGEYTKNAFADFLLGAASAETLSNWSYLALRDSVHAFFRAGRLEGEPPAHAEHRAALRTEPAAGGEGEHDLEFRSGHESRPSGAGAGGVAGEQLGGPGTCKA